MKRQTTKDILVASFQELALKKPIDKITIQDIANESGYSPATFYRHFRDKFDLIAWDYSQHTKNIMNQGKDWKASMKEGYLYLNDQKKYMRNLLLHTSGLDSFIRYMAYTSVELITDRIFIKEELDQNLKAIIKIYAYGSVALTCDWLLDEEKMDIDQVVDIMILALPERLKVLLL
ncbi:TetR/AcrR family transcriptional regulator [Sharpea azabuensis]|uniref:TetR/AcrR family transcriptional regulator n=1 Tax=Sharpea azabuensis TaxID=322505 RepID=UPI002409DD6A|nr:TetR/AcrR family transcriptional regulator [Sharpea azabuensis]MDD6512167.1 TetR/AcrR family transcriptional regulator [Sharpea azabuensis]